MGMGRARMRTRARMRIRGKVRMRTRMRVRMQRYVDGAGVETSMEVKTGTAQMLVWGWRLARSGR